jgi:lipopolysaccharide export system permease protein
VYFIYFTLLSAGKVWIERGMAPAWLGLWWVHLLMVAYAAVLLFRDHTLSFQRGAHDVVAAP